jgi:hypothetical protein
MSSKRCRKSSQPSVFDTDGCKRIKEQASTESYGLSLQSGMPGEREATFYAFPVQNGSLQDYCEKGQGFNTRKLKASPHVVALWRRHVEGRQAKRAKANLSNSDSADEEEEDQDEPCVRAMSREEFALSASYVRMVDTIDTDADAFVTSHCDSMSKIELGVLIWDLCCVLVFICTLHVLTVVYHSLTRPFPDAQMLNLHSTRSLNHARPHRTMGSIWTCTLLTKAPRTKHCKRS